jgi:hypothetical protein
VCTRGDLVRLVHDVALADVVSARVTAVVNNQSNQTIAITGDEYFNFVGGKNYQLRYRTQQGDIRTIALDNGVGKTDEFIFKTAVASHLAPAVGDLCAVGEINADVKSLIVTAIEPLADFKARVTAVDAVKAMYDENEAELPLVIEGDYVVAPSLEAPIITSIQSSEEVMIANIDGSMVSRVVIQLAPPQNIAITGVHVFVKALDETAYSRANILSYSNHQISVLGLEKGEHYNFIVKYEDQLGQLSPSSQVANHLIVGTARAPADVMRFHVVSNGQSNYLSWQAVNEINLSHYVIKFTSDLNNPSWANAAILNEQVPKAVTSLTTPRAVGTYFIKAYDYSGRSSNEAARAQTSVTVIDEVNIIETVDESASYQGEFAGTAIYSQNLILMPTDSFDSVGDVDTLSAVDFEVTATVRDGSYIFKDIFDLGHVYTSHVAPMMQAAGIDLGVLFDHWDEFDSVENIDQAVDPSLWNAEIFVKTTEDIPSNLSAWSAWRPLTVGDYTARAFQFKVDLKSMQTGVTPAVSLLQVMIDMPDRTLAKKGLVTTLSGLAVAFDYPFYETPVFAVHGYGLNTGDYYRLTNVSESGFTITFYDASNAPIVRTCDVIAKGYGVRY